MDIFLHFIVRKPAFFLTLLVSLACIFAGLLSTPTAVYAAQAVANGYRDFTFPNVGAGNNENEVTGEKSESKLWWNDGYWWASMLKSGSTSYHIFRLNMVTQDWEDTGVILDDRLLSRADVLWDGVGNKLYVASHVFAFTSVAGPAGQRGELFRYSYNADTDTYSLDAGFPVEVNQAKTEALVLAKDSTGTLWVAYVESGQVKVNHTLNNNDATWGTPYVLPVGTNSTVDPSDMASIIAYNGRIGVMWSNQTSSKKMYFAAHVDGAGDTAADWTSLAAYTASGDDHLNLKTLQSDNEGHLYAVVKTSFQLNSNPAQPWIVLLACKTFPCTAANNWTPYTVWTTSDKSPTRPQLLIDTTNRDLYVFSRIIYDLNNNKKGIYYKSSDLDNISFTPGDGQAFITSATENNINNPTTTKQTVNSTTGLVVLASDDSAKYYFHNCLTLTSPGVTCGPNASASVGFASATYSAVENEPSATITVTLNHAATKVVTINFATSNGTANADNDYTEKSGSLSFAIGETRKTFTVPLLNDNIDEVPETVNLTLSGPTNASLGMPSAATLSITDDEITPTLQIDPAALSVIENVAGGNAPITVTLSGLSANVVQVNYASSNGTATQSLDFTPISNTLTFSPGQTSKVLLLPIMNDALDEEDETVSLLLSNVSNALLPNPAPSLLIHDDDALPTVQFIAPTLVVTENVNLANLVVTLSAPSGRPVMVNYSATTGTATAGSDYTLTNGMLTFAPGETSKNVAVTLLNDSADEANETVTVALSAPTNVTSGSTANVLVTILDDDVPLTAEFSAATFTANESAAKGMIMIKLSTPAPTLLAVGYTISNGTAQHGQDYLGSTTGTVTFNPGESSKSFEIAVNNDTIDEDDEKIKLTLNNPTQGLQLSGLTSATLTIVDNDNPPLAQWSVGNFTVNENDGSGQALLNVHLSVASGRPVSLTYSVSDGTAQAGSDYQASSGVVVLNPGETEKTVVIGLVNDAVVEGNETLALTLTGAKNANLGAIQSTHLTIVDEDGLPLVHLQAITFSEVENVLSGIATVTVALRTPSNQPVTVNYNTSDGSALAGSDYETTSGTLTFAPGELTKNITIKLFNDSQAEENESINLSLSNGVGAVVGAPTQAILVIVDDDGLPRVRFQNSTYNVSEDVGVATMIVTLTSAPAVTLTVPISVVGGTADTNDYQMPSHSLTFAPGQTTQSIELLILDDELMEEDETVLLTLQGKGVVALGFPTSATLTILDNDQVLGNLLYLPVVLQQ